MEYNDFFKNPPLGEGREGGTLVWGMTLEKQIEYAIHGASRGAIRWKGLRGELNYMKRVREARKLDLLIFQYFTQNN